MEKEEPEENGRGIGKGANRTLIAVKRSKFVVCVCVKVSEAVLLCEK